jgi:ABC-type multidrug transport system ATPase subunit
LVEEHGKTVVLATNLLEEAWSLSDRIAVLRAGRIVAVDAPHRLQSRLRNQRCRIVIDRPSHSLLSRARSVPGVVGISTREADDQVTIEVEIEPVSFSLTALLRAVSANGVDVRAISADQATPSEVFAACMEE